MNVAIEIPDEVARQLEARSRELSRAVLEAVAVEAYRAGTITPAQVQQMLDRKSTRLNSSHIQKSRMPSSA